MTLLDNMKVLMPLTPDPPHDNMKNISDALELAITSNIRTSFVPGIGQVFISYLKAPNPFLVALGLYLDVTITPIISAALAAQSSIGTIPAWISVQPSFDAISLVAPPIMAGPMGLLFWQSIVTTIRLAISIVPGIEDSAPTTNSNETINIEEVLRVET